MKEKTKVKTREARNLDPGDVALFFELRGQDGKDFTRCVASFAKLDVSKAQVAKMLLKVGLNEWLQGEGK